MAYNLINAHKRKWTSCHFTDGLMCQKVRGCPDMCLHGMTWHDIPFEDVCQNQYPTIHYNMEWRSERHGNGISCHLQIPYCVHGPCWEILQLGVILELEPAGSLLIVCQVPDDDSTNSFLPHMSVSRNHEPDWLITQNNRSTKLIQWRIQVFLADYGTTAVQGHHTQNVTIYHKLPVKSTSISWI